MNEQGGIKDDCIITKDEDQKFFVVINAGCKFNDLKHINEMKNNSEWKNKDISIVYSEDNSLVSV